MQLIRHVCVQQLPDRMSAHIVDHWPSPAQPPASGRAVSLSLSAAEHHIVVATHITADLTLLDLV